MRSSRKVQIETLATQMFENKGFKATSMRDLATELKIEASSLYSHIKSKEELLQKICFNMAALFFDALEAVETLSLSPGEKLKKAVVAHVSVITANPSASAVFFSEWRHLSDPYLSEFLGLRSTYEAKIRNIIKEGVEKGAFSVPDQKLAVLTLLSSINWIHQWYDPKGMMKGEEIGEKLADFILYGLKSTNKLESTL